MRAWPFVVAGVVVLVAIVVGANKDARDAVGEAVDEIVDKFNETLKGLIARFEGLRLEVYQDTGGAWTIGYGHLIQPGEPYHPYGPIREIDQETADRLFEQDTAIARRAVDLNVKVLLTDNQRAALVSFVFNVGTSAFAKSTLLKKLNAGDYVGAANEMDRWVYDNGVRSEILAKRRDHEQEIFLA